MGIWNWLDQAMGLIYGGVPWGVQHWLDRGDGIDVWGCIMGACDWIRVMELICGGRVMGCVTLAGSGRWDWFMGVHHGGTWLDRAMEVICGGAPWGRATLARSGGRDWFIGTCHGGVRCWLDWGDGTDFGGRAKWQNTMWLLNLNDDTMCPHVWRWGKCSECVWLRGW